MCGRTKLAVERDRLSGFEEIQDVALGPSMEAWTPREEIAPTDLSPVLVRGASGQVELEQQRWGVPSPPSVVPPKPVFNARSDKLTSSFWAPMFRHRRCVAVVEGWYEWLLLDGKKVRYLFTAADGDLLYFPAVYRERVATTEPRAYATVTCDPGDLVARYHHREPVTLSADDVARWLDPATSREALIAMLVPAPSGRLAVAPSPASETARALKPAPSPPAQGSLFDVEPKKRRPS